ncbi:protein HEG homolog 1-like [Sinocyclocheilus anshuiensis]|uniref:protein HEG homolog 1-like n=1 Tax=Sinocyclocheilus anshuiensis TaxID=1608454 RepID=UPI0007B9CD9F|nr:PREDICTED: protein HEG homolog 1-like [Sinocyclocheilus anshuiensis]
MHSSEEGPTFSETGHPLTPAFRSLEPPHVVSRWDAEVLVDLPQVDVDIITSARAPSTRRAYTLKWNLFVEWCSSHREDSWRCPIRAMLSFLQEGVERRLSPSTLKVYFAAITAHQDPVNGESLGKHEEFLRSVMRLNPPRPNSIPSCDLSLVLTALQRAPFELLQSAELKIVDEDSALDCAGFHQEDPEGSGTDTTDLPGTTDTPATTTQGPCDSSPCIGDSTCDARFDGTFVCICRLGLVYNQISGCVQTKVFPGSLTLSAMFKPEMTDRKSKEFQIESNRIENEVRDLSIVLNGNGYIRSIVLSLSQGSIIAEVQNFYDMPSTVTKELVESQIQEAILENKISGATEFKENSVCDLGACDSTTTNCGELVSGVAMCTCKEEYVRSQATSQACLACPNGEKAVDSKICEKCPFGYAGFNCNDPYLLVVIVVSTVLGALLVIFIVALIVVSFRNQKGNTSSEVDFSSSYGNKELHKPTGIPRIPRANPDASWKSNNLEMTSGSNQALVIRDRPESKARYTDFDEDMSYRGHVPPAYSGYSGRGVDNGGVHNPYFRQDDDRMRRY